MAKDTLFPAMPDDLAKLSGDDIEALLAEFEQARKLIEENNAEFLDGFTADEVLAEFKTGALGIMALREEKAARVKAEEDYTDAITDISKSLEVKAESEEGEGEGEGDGDGGGDEAGDGEGDGEGDEEGAQATAEVKAESGGEGDGGDGDGDGDGDGEGEGAEAAAQKEAVLVADASGETTSNTKSQGAVRVRRPLPVPTNERVVVNEEAGAELAFVASGFVGTPPGTKFTTTDEVAGAMHAAMKNLGRPAKRPDGREERHLVASLDYSDNFPEERRLDGDWVKNGEKIAAAGSLYQGKRGIEALIASGGLCAPLQPLYTMPNLATEARPVRDALPSFRAERGGINVPEPTIVSDANGAITVITEAEDALGGTFATKACLDLDCPDYTETAVTVISHCREFGNLNAFAWPEKLRHENEITMAAHARAAESYLLSRIKAQSIAVTVGAETLGALIYLVDAIRKSAFGIRSRLRMPSEARFQLLAPRVLADILVLDTVQTQFDRYRSQGAIDDYLASIGVDVTWYIDTASPRPGVSDGSSMIADAAQTAGAIDPFPDTIDMAFFPAGTFLHLDMAELNLGIVRDSTLNSTNDFQVFGESFENVARIGPAQAAYWITADLCASGQFPPAGTARTCD